MPKKQWLVRFTTVYFCHNYQQMEDPVTDGDDYPRHRQIIVADVVEPISHSISSSSSITPTSPTSSAFSPSDDSAVPEVPVSAGVCFDTVYFSGCYVIRMISLAIAFQWTILFYEITVIVNRQFNFLELVEVMIRL